MSFMLTSYLSNRAYGADPHSGLTHTQVRPVHTGHPIHTGTITSGLLGSLGSNVVLTEEATTEIKL